MPIVNRAPLRPEIGVENRPFEAPVLLRESALALGQPRQADARRDAQQTPGPPAPEPLSLTAVGAGHTAGLVNMSRAKMMTSLSRIEARVDTLLQRETDPTAVAELQLGLKVLGEHLRRLSLVQSASDAVIGQ